MSSLNPGICPLCNRPATRISRAARVRRGERVLALELHAWECSSGCAGPDGEHPFRFVDAPLAGENDRASARAWREEFSEEIPKPRIPGRRVQEKRSIPVHIMLTPSELVMLDQLRGQASRSQFIRGKMLAGQGSRRMT